MENKNKVLYIMSKSSLGKVFGLESGTVEALRRNNCTDETGKLTSYDLTWAKQEQFCRVCDQMVMPSYKATIEQNNGNFVCKICRTSFHTCPDGSYSNETPTSCEKCKKYIDKAKGTMKGHVCYDGKRTDFSINECERCGVKVAKKGFDVMKVDMEKVYEYTTKPRFIDKK